MLSKEEIKIQMGELPLKGMKLSFEEKFKGIAFSCLYFKGELVGWLECQQRTNSDWEVMEVDCKIKGFGKFLYYNMMENIYPKYLMSGRVVSLKAMRVWNGIFQVCESKPIPLKYESFGKVVNSKGETSWGRICNCYRIKF